MIQPMVDKSKLQRGKRIAEAIQSAGLTQREVADVIGVTPQSITKWIKSGNIYIDNLQMLADVTSVSVRYIITGERDEKIAERKGQYHKANEALHKLVDKLDQPQAKRLSLCASAILDAEEGNLALTIHVGNKQVL